MKIIFRMRDSKKLSLFGIAIVLLAPALIPDLFSSEQTQKLMEYFVQLVGVLVTASGKSILKE